MQKFWSNGAITATLLTLLFFIPQLLLLRIPFPADAALGLYHPFRDITIDGYAPGTFPAKNPAITDPILQAYPWRHLIVDNFKNGQFPLWNPYSFSGQPLLANIQSAPFAITNLPFLILPFNLAWAISLILPSAATTFFMYLFLRELKLSTAASIFGAFVLPLSGFFIAWLSWGSIVATVMWLPLILLSISKISQKLSVWWFLILTFAITQTILSGHWQAGSYVALASFLFLILTRKQLAGPQNLFIVITSVILATVISMVQILPSLEFLKLSARDLDQGYYSGRQDWFIPRQHLIQLIAPDFFGNPTTYNYWGVFNYGEFVAFIGIIPLTLALVAAVTRTPNVNFFVILAALALFLGLENPLSKIPFTANLPLISSSQPSRIIFLLDFALVALAAIGLETFLKEKARFKLILPSLLILAALGVFLLASLTQTFFPQDPHIDTASIAARNLVIPIATISLFIILTLTKRFTSSKIIIAAIFFLTVLELFRFGNKFTSFSKISWIFPETQTTQFLKSQGRPFRILTTDRRIFHPNTPAVYGIESVDGYDPLYLASYNNLVSVWQSGNAGASLSAFNRIVTPQKYDSPIADLLGVKYVLTFDEIKSPNFEKVFEEGKIKVYQNLNALPRFYFVDQVRGAQSQSDELAYLLDPNSPLEKVAISREFNADLGSANGNISLITYQDGQIILKTSNQKESPMVIGNINYPGWQAYIDGAKSPVKEVNFLFQSVIIPAGEHVVELKFQPKSFYNGLYLSLAGIALTALAGFLIRVKRESWKKKSQ